MRSLLRHRDSLVKTAARSVQHRQKAYDQMNVHLHHAISDLIKALEGDWRSEHLFTLRHAPDLCALPTAHQRV